MSSRALVIALALASACGDGTPRVTTLRLWAMGREGELVSELLVDFERAHPDIHVEVQQLPWNTAHEKLLTAFVGDSTPDVAQLGNTWVAELAALDALAPLDTALAASTVVAPADYFPGIWATNVIDGVTWGIPWYVDTRLLFYRRDLLAAAGVTAAPTSWSDWLTAMRAVKAARGPDRYAILLPLDESDQLVALGLQQPEPMLRDNARYGNFHNPGFRRAFRFYLDLFAERLAPVATETDVPNPWEELGRGYYAFLIHGPWSIAELERRLPPALRDSWETAPLPGPDGPGISSAGGSSLVVFRRSAHAREAWQLIEYLAQPSVQARFYTTSGNMPPRRSTWDAPVLRDSTHARAFRDQLERVRGTPQVPEWERIVTEMRHVTEAAARQVTPATTAAELDALADDTTAELDRWVDDVLAKRRWILEQRGAR